MLRWLLVGLLLGGVSCSPQALPAVPTLKILTYNVLQHPIQVGKRVPALLALCKTCDPDVLAFQEVTPWFRELLLREDWVKNYVPSDLSAPGGLLILSKYPMKASFYRALPGRLGRGVMVATLSVGGRDLRVATTHLESHLEDGPIRSAQLDLIFPLLEGMDSALLMGDFNFGDGEEPDTAHLDRRYQDLWKVLRPEDPGFTWNIERSPIDLPPLFGPRL